MTREERIEYLAKAVMTLSELGDNKTASVLNEIRLELKQQPSLPSDVDEAARDYSDSSDWQLGENLEHIDAAFIAGAEWQKEQMLKEAVDADVADLNGDIYNHCIEIGLTDEDKVKIIIVKEDKK